ncbi:MAG: VOC family protein [Sphingobacteriales bacterium]|nr:MAG: VOC family protein [Sphingobacteriales bacterium]
MKNRVSITPFLTVGNCAEAIKFYVSALQATEVSRYDMANGKIGATLNIEGAEFYVSDEEPEFGNVSPVVAASVQSVRIILTTPNADNIFENALAHGATQICAMTTEEDWRIGKLRDPFGHVWEIGYML